jgi:hypothetical protein
MRLRTVGLLTSFSLLLSSGATSAQNANALINIFSGFMQSAMIQSAQPNGARSLQLKSPALTNRYVVKASVSCF